MHTTSSTLLIRLRQNNDHLAWSRFVQLYTPLLFFWARKTGLNETDAADLVQELLAVLVTKFGEFEYLPVAGKAGQFRAWLRTVAMNKWRDMRKRKRPEALSPHDDAFAGLSLPSESEEFWQHDFHQHLVARALEIMKAEFQPTTWQACWETTVEGRPAAEVAQELGISVGAVFVAKSRVLRKLREELVGMLEETL